LAEVEMAAIHEHVGRDQDLGSRGWRENCAIITDPKLGPPAGPGSLALADPVNQGEFARGC
jgi:hypothetical protein